MFFFNYTIKYEADNDKTFCNMCYISERVLRLFGHGQTVSWNCQQYKVSQFYHYVYLYITNFTEYPRSRFPHPSYPLHKQHQNNQDPLDPRLNRTGYCIPVLILVL